jgi:benzodiazapine receptor
VIIMGAVFRWVNILAFVLTIIVNGLAGSTTLIGGKITREISDANPTLITPAGYVFSIWGLIYLLLGIFVVYQALPSNQGKKFQKKVGWFFALSSIFNVAWLFLWQYGFLIESLILMILLLATLITIYLRLNIGKNKTSFWERLTVHLPFSVYLGWITIATIANVAVALVSVKWDSFGLAPEIWAAIVIALALIITLLVLSTRKDIAFALVIIWALVGIGVNQSGNSMIVLLTQISATSIAIATIVVIVFTVLKRI